MESRQYAQVSFKQLFVSTNLRMTIALAVLLIGYVLAVFHRVAIAIIADQLVGDLGLSVAQLSVLTAVYFYPYAFMQFPVGILVDRFGAKGLVSGMLVVAGFASIAFSFADSFGTALVVRLIIGLSVSCLFVPTQKYMANSFPPQTFATLTSVLVFAGIFGSLLASVPLAYVVVVLGWRAVFVGLGVFSAILGVALWFLLDNVGKSLTSSSSEHHTWGGVKQVLREPSLWPNVIRCFLGYGSIMTFQSLWAGPYLITTLGLDRITAGYLLMLMSLGQLIILPFGGILTDRIFRSRKKPLLVASFGMMLFWVPFAFYGQQLVPWQIGTLFVLCGLLSGLGAGPTFTLLKELYPVSLAGTAIGIGNFFNMIGPAVVPVLLGLMLGSKQAAGSSVSPENIVVGFRYLMVLSGVAFVAMCFSKDTYWKSSGGKDGLV